MIYSLIPMRKNRTSYFDSTILQLCYFISNSELLIWSLIYFQCQKSADGSIPPKVGYSMIWGNLYFEVFLSYQWEVKYYGCSLDQPEYPYLHMETFKDPLLLVTRIPPPPKGFYPRCSWSSTKGYWGGCPSPRMYMWKCFLHMHVAGGGESYFFPRLCMINAEMNVFETTLLLKVLEIPIPCS